MGARKVSNSKSDLQGQSKALTKTAIKCHIRVPIN